VWYIILFFTMLLIIISIVAAHENDIQEVEILCLFRMIGRLQTSLFQDMEMKPSASQLCGKYFIAFKPTSFYYLLSSFSS